jgi:hypothetical protein
MTLRHLTARRPPPPHRAKPTGSASPRETHRPPRGPRPHCLIARNPPPSTHRVENRWPAIEAPDGAPALPPSASRRRHCPELSTPREMSLARAPNLRVRQRSPRRIPGSGHTHQPDGRGCPRGGRSCACSCHCCFSLNGLETAVTATRTFRCGPYRCLKRRETWVKAICARPAATWHAPEADPPDGAPTARGRAGVRPKGRLGRVVRLSG